MTLNIANEDERIVQEVVDWWQHQRAKATKIRRAILLYFDLEQGRTDRLFQDFPQIEALMLARGVGEQHEQRLKDIEDFLIQREGERLLGQGSGGVKN